MTDHSHPNNLRRVLLPALSILMLFAALLPVTAAEQAPTGTTFYALRVGDSYILSPSQDEKGLDTGAWGSNDPVVGAVDAPYVGDGREWEFILMPQYSRFSAFSDGNVIVEIWFGADEGIGIHKVGWELTNGDGAVASGAVQDATVKADYQLLTWTVKPKVDHIAGDLTFRVFTESSFGLGERLLLGPDRWTTVQLPIEEKVVAPILGGSDSIWVYKSLTGPTPSTREHFQGAAREKHVLNWTHDTSGVTLDVRPHSSSTGRWYVGVYIDNSSFFDVDSRTEPYGSQHSNFAKGHRYVIEISAYEWTGDIDISLKPNATKGPAVIYSKEAPGPLLGAVIGLAVAAAWQERRTLRESRP